MDQRKLHKGFAKKGFTIEDDGKHYWVRIYDGGLPTAVRSKAGGKSPEKYKYIDNDILLRIKRDLYFESKNDLLDFISCPLSKEAYFDQLIQRGIFSKRPITDRQ